MKYLKTIAALALLLGVSACQTTGSSGMAEGWGSCENSPIQVVDASWAMPDEAKPCFYEYSRGSSMASAHIYVRRLARGDENATIVFRRVGSRTRLPPKKLEDQARMFGLNRDQIRQVSYDRTATMNDGRKINYAEFTKANDKCYLFSVRLQGESADLNGSACNLTSKELADFISNLNINNRGKMETFSATGLSL